MGSSQIAQSTIRFSRASISYTDLRVDEAGRVFRWELRGHVRVARSVETNGVIVPKGKDRPYIPTR